MGKHRFVIDGKAFDVEVHSAGHGTGLAEVSVNGVKHRVELPATQAAVAPSATSAQPRPRPRPSVAVHGELRAPMAGLVLKTPEVGQRVRAGEPLIVLDAMKMENTLAATSDGVVEEVGVARGDTVLRGALLVRLG